jgi:hypothetical protein
MPSWNPDMEPHLRKLGDYLETQINDLLDPKTSVTGTSMRILFRTLSTGMRAIDHACDKAGMDFTGDWLGDLKTLCDLAEKNGSKSAEKIRKALPVAEELSDLFKKEKATTIRQKIRAAKGNKDIKFNP